jgi:ABC-type nitrate/sulfonate/bicarbonate transport system permease component
MSRRLRNVALELWLPLALIAGWWILSADSTSFYWPPLSEILETFREDWLFARVGTDLIPSLERVVIGYAIAVVIGVTVGVSLGLYPLARRASEPILDFFRAMPKPALLPIAIVALGVGDGSKVFLIAFGSVWPVLLASIDGVRGVDPNLLDMSRVYGLSKRRTIRDVILPAASPQIFVGARVGLAIALILMVLSELIASTNGLGFYVLLSQQSFAIPEMWAGTILLGIIGYSLNLMFSIFEDRALAWHRGWRSATLGRVKGVS